VLVPTRVSVDVSLGEQLVDFRCSRCGHRAQAWVSGGGTGLKVNMVSLSNAQLDAAVGAAQAARLAPCPRCGHRDRPALAKVLLAWGAVGALAGFAIGLVAAEQLRGSALDGGGVHVGVAVFLAVVVTMTALKLRSVRRRVQFHRDA
jgi:DNA-directed RNA polymerase subunit RPC12/RpoP